jgi:hypothetical protein
MLVSRGRSFDLHQRVLAAFVAMQPFMVLETAMGGNVPISPSEYFQKKRDILG